MHRCPSQGLRGLSLLKSPQGREKLVIFAGQPYRPGHGVDSLRRCFALEGDASPDQRGRPITIVAWCFAFALAIGLLGFKIGGSLCTLLFLWLTARESWKVTAGLTIGTYLFFIIT